MELKCKINGKEYNITQGVSFSEEYNETLDSGTIIISQIKKIEDIEPYDDVYIYDKEFDGYGSKKIDYKKIVIDEDEMKYQAIEFTKYDDGLIVNFNIPENFMNAYFHEGVVSKKIAIKAYRKNEDDVLVHDLFDFTIINENDYYYLTSEQLNFEKQLEFVDELKLWHFSSGETFILSGYETAEIFSFYVTFDENLSEERNYDSKKSLEFISIEGERKVEIIAKIQNEIVEVLNNSDYIVQSKELQLITFQEEESGTAINSYLNCDIVKEDDSYYFYILDFGFRKKIVYIEEKDWWSFEEEEIFISGYDEIRVNKFEVNAIYNYKERNNLDFTNDYAYQSIKEYEVLNFYPETEKNLLFIAKIPNDFILSLFSDDEILSCNMSLIALEEEEDGTAINSYLDCEIIKEDDKYYFIIDKINFREELVYVEDKNIWEFKDNSSDINVYIAGYDKVFVNKFDITTYYDPKKKNNFYKHLLIDTINREELNFDERLFKYTINLFSETKRLEKVQLPNFSITEPVYSDLKKSAYSYIVDIVDMYSPIYKIVDDEKAQTWRYQKKYIVDPELEKIFGDVYSPDFTLNNPNLRDVLAKIMLTKDRIPYVEDDIIKALDITARTKEFDINYDYVNYVYSSKNSGEYCTSLKTTYSDALSQNNSCRMTEYLSFRNSSTSLMTFENMRLETTYPIYKINKLYMCYFKRVYVKETIDDDVVSTPKYFLCKQDISSLIKLNSERNVLSEDWSRFNNIKDITLKDLQEFKFTTIGYDIGSKFIDGWGQKMTSYAIFNWFPDVETYIEKIYKSMEELYPYGLYSINYLRKIFKLNSNQTLDVPYGVGSPIPSYFLSPFDNQVAGYKSFFFEIEYDGFYNGTIYHSKDNITRDGIFVNDNPSSSLSLLELDGIAQKEKINRFGNEIFQINARYIDFNQLQPLGSVFNSKDKADEDVVIYSREFSMFDNVINCKYVGAKDYVLKNYFTSVYAKHRPYNLMSYNESVYRSENRKIFLILDTDKKYIENNNEILSFTKFAEEENVNNRFNHIYKILSFFKENPFTDKNKSINEDKINYGFFTFNGVKYASDINVFNSGNSLCFNLKMYDNIGAGVYIKPENIEPFTLGTIKDFFTIEDDVTGSLQDWYLTVDSDETGFAEKIGFYVCHVDKENYIKEVYDNEDDIIGKEKKKVEIYNPSEEEQQTKNIKVIKENTVFRKMFELPKLNLQDSLITNLIGNEYLVKKDNKELIDMTFQIEPISNNEKILFSPWMLKLSNLNGNYKKLYQKAVVPNGIKENEIMNSLSFEYVQAVRGYETIKTGSGKTIENGFPIMILEMDENIVNEIRASFENGEQYLTTSISMWFRERFRKDSDEFYPSENHVDIAKLNILLDKIIGYDFSVLNYETITLKGEQTITYREIRWSAASSGYVGMIPYKTEKMTVKMDFKKVSGIPVKTKKEEYYLYPPEGKIWFVFDTYEQKIKTPSTSKGYIDFYNLVNYSSSDNYIITKDENLDNTNSIRDVASLEVPINISYSQNLFIATSNQKMKYYEVYNKYKDLIQIGVNQEDINIYVNEVFSFSSEDSLTIDLNKFNKEETKCVQLWYKDDSGALNFVFGVNVDVEDFEKGQVDVYISVLTNRDLRVFDALHNVIGEIKNVANVDEENINYADKHIQKYNKNE